MEYQKFEYSYDRRTAALHLVKRIEEQIAKGRGLLEGRIPDSSEISDLMEKWLPEDRFVCQYQERDQDGKPEAPCNWEPQECGRRCSAGYWRKHCGEVASMMESLATVLGEPKELWRTTGLLHDLDYVRYPHHEKAIGSEKSHPLGISTYLFQEDAPPILILAILSHAPHLQLRPESALGWAILACDEHATMSGFGIVPRYRNSIDPRLTACMRPAAGKLQGFHRNDMEGRANLAMLELTRILHEKSPSLQLEPNRSSPFDWDQQIEEAFPNDSW